MMKAGRYYVGDLCYVLHDEWPEVCDLIIEGNKCLQGEFNLKDGRRFAIYNTAYGDGTYYDQDGNAYGVDSGSIGCILFDDIDWDCARNATDGGNLSGFHQDFYTGAQDGKIMFGSISIDTDPQEEE